MGVVTATLSFGEESIVSDSHPAIIQAFSLASGTATLKAGTMAAKNSSGDIVEYDRAGASPLNVTVGVLTKSADTANDETANVLVHGCYIESALLHKGTAATAADIDVLRQKTIFGV